MSTRSILVICPDYASHVYPMGAVAAACVRRGMSVTFATGPGMEGTVRRAGLNYERIILGPGSNTGVMQAEKQGSEQEHMRAFFSATARGPVPTLLYQSHARGHDMLYAPDAVFKHIAALLEQIRPDLVLVDQLSYGATLALHALGQPFASFHPGHPAAIPTPGRVFGLPEHFPPPLEVDEDDRAELAAIATQTTGTFTDVFNEALAHLSPHALPVENAFAFTSPRLVLLNYPRALAADRAIPQNAHFLGSCLRRESADAEALAALDRLPPGRPLVYVSFGTFLSARDDVLRVVAEALRRVPANVVLASGSTDTSAWQPVPGGWLIRPVLPQIEVLRRADLVITHGGNNTVTEALTLAIPLLVGPFSSDQFDTASDVQRARAGEVFDPNRVNPEELAGQVTRLLHDASLHARLEHLSRSVLADGGIDHAAALIATCAGGEPTPSPDSVRESLIPPDEQPYA